ncbi:restriction endonuclease subunit S [Xenorhabdus bovienii]|uniref:Restriction modification system DNA specificity domain n=1 Tax=Xenorhabdus bovienii TaxID=40576 RepID=A0A0B6X4F7_XENBV|nr:restriction endonuclease subunit S [Xenorhabdus bovienii]CDM88702.1 Restriction modification system DNA specificity domain [Xenorhabdus bovienii]
MSWPLVCIGDCVEKVASWNPLKSESQTPFFYIDLSSVDKDKKAVDRNGVSKVLPNDAPSRARQIVKSGDVLVATVRPNLNGVALVPEEYEGATASTGYCVLRSEGNRLDSKYLYYWVQTRVFVTDMMEKATGANYPAVSDKIIKESKIPLPPLTEQKRIAAILDKADAIRRKCQQAIQLANEFLRAVFLDMFGDPETKGWKFTTVENMAAKCKGSMRTGPFGSDLKHSEFINEGILVLGIDNAVSNKFRRGKERFISQEKYEQLKRYTVNPGDVLITIMGTCGRCAVVPDDIPLAINTKHLCCITLDKNQCIPSFLHSYFLVHPIARRYLGQKAKGAIMDGLNMGMIKEMPIPIVPINEQKKYESISVKVAKLIENQYEGNEATRNNFLSISQKAFSGEL